MYDIVKDNMILVSILKLIISATLIKVNERLFSPVFNTAIVAVRQVGYSYSLPGTAIPKYSYKHVQIERETVTIFFLCSTDCYSSLSISSLAECFRAYTRIYVRSDIVCTNLQNVASSKSEKIESASLYSTLLQRRRSLLYIILLAHPNQICDVLRAARQAEKATYTPSQGQNAKIQNKQVRWDFWTKLRKASFSCLYFTWF